MKTKRFFTLIELIIVITILAILMAFLLPAISNAITNSKVEDVRINMQTVIAGYDAYYKEYNIYPENPDDLAPASSNNPRGLRFPGANANLKTPWGDEFYICVDGQSTTATSSKGGKVIADPDGTEDDKVAGLSLNGVTVKVSQSIIIYADHPQGDDPIKSWNASDEYQ